MSKTIHVYLSKTQDVQPNRQAMTIELYKLGRAQGISAKELNRIAMMNDVNMQKEIDKLRSGDTKDAASMNEMDNARKEIEALCRTINNAVSEEKGVVAASAFGKIAAIASKLARV